MELTSAIPTMSAPDIRTNPVILGACSWLPDGRLDLGDGRSATVGEMSGPDMAVEAARAVLASARVDPLDVTTVLHAWSNYQGHDFWSPAHYVAHAVGALSATPVGINQMCNGAAAAVEIARDRLARPQRGSSPSPLVLITTGDSFRAPAFDRRESDYGSVYGDGGTALLLGAAPAAGGTGAVTVRSIASDAAPELEVMNRGSDPMSPAARWYRGCVDVRSAKKHHLRRTRTGAYAERERRAIETVLTEALAEARVDRFDPRVRSVMVPRLSPDILESVYQPILHEWFDVPVADYGSGSGHLGAGDLVANLADGISDGTIDSDGLAVLLSAGAGFTWSAVVVGGIASH